MGVGQAFQTDCLYNRVASVSTSKLGTEGMMQGAMLAYCEWKKYAETRKLAVRLVSRLQFTLREVLDDSNACGDPS